MAARLANCSCFYGFVLPRFVLVGSIITALAVTPLEVVKIRQQQLPTTPPVASPSNIYVCRGCGTFIFHNGLTECVLPKSAVPYFDATTGLLKNPLVPASDKSTGNSSNSRSSSTSTVSMIRRIFQQEGFTGLYAGLAPTLVMGVPNTVLYFVTYETLVTKWRTTNNESYIPALAGASARCVASIVTAPLELIRTRQAARIGNAQPSLGWWQELQSILYQQQQQQQPSSSTSSSTSTSSSRTSVGGSVTAAVTAGRTSRSSLGGIVALYQGLSPTLLRDVPFSAIYWFWIEWLRRQWTTHLDNNHDGSHDRRTVYTPWEQAGQALINGSIAGMIAAACTTPLDVIKTRRQLEVMTALPPPPMPPLSSTASHTVSEQEGTKGQGRGTATSYITTKGGNGSGVTVPSSISCCEEGVMVYEPPILARSNKPVPTGTLQMMQHIVEQEGIGGLWRGNTTRMIKVAPACAIMIASYEFGKVSLSHGRL